MSAYDNNPTLPGTFVDAHSATTPDSQTVTAAKMNAMVTAIADLRAALVGGTPSEGGAANYLTLIKNTSPPSSAALAAALYTDGANLLAAVNGIGAQRVIPQYVNVKSPQFGAKGDGRVLTGCSISSSSHALASPGAGFALGDVGKPILVRGAGTAGADLYTTISGFTDSSHVTLTAAAATGVSGVRAVYGTDDTSACQAADTYIQTLSNTYHGVFFDNKGAPELFYPTGIYMVNGTVITTPVCVRGEDSTIVQMSSTVATMRYSAGTVIVRDLIFNDGYAAISIVTGDVSHCGLHIQNCEMQGQLYGQIIADDNSASTFTYVNDCTLIANTAPILNAQSGYFYFQNCQCAAPTGAYAFDITSCALYISTHTAAGGGTPAWVGVRATGGDNSIVVIDGNSRFGGESGGECIVEWHDTNKAGSSLTVRDSACFAGGAPLFNFYGVPSSVVIRNISGTPANDNAGGIMFQSSMSNSDKLAIANGSIFDVDSSLDNCAIYNGIQRVTFSSLSDPNVWQSAFLSEKCKGASWGTTDASPLSFTAGDPDGTYTGFDESSANVSLVGGHQVVNAGSDSGQYRLHWDNGLQNLATGLYTALFYFNEPNPVNAFLAAGDTLRTVVVPSGKRVIAQHFYRIQGTSSNGIGATVDSGPNQTVDPPTRVVVLPGYVESGNVPWLELFGSSLPTTGQFVAGDRVRFLSPTNGVQKDSVCTASGQFAPPWTASTAMSAAVPTTSYVTNDGGKVYRAISTTGDNKTAASGGPTGTGSSITDNHVTWAYVTTLPTFATQGSLEALVDGSSGHNGVLKLYDNTAGKYVYLYSNNGVLTVQDTLPS